MTGTEVKVEPVRKEIVVEATPERAFRIFTDNGKWWPRSHHIGKADLDDAIIEPRAGGRWYERGVDGSECDWGRVLVWDPPKRLVLAWQLTAQWQFDPNFVTEVEVRFIPIAPGQTRVELEHRDLERYGAGVEELRKSVDSPGGWQGILEEYAKAVQENH